MEHLLFIAQTLQYKLVVHRKDTMTEEETLSLEMVKVMNIDNTNAIQISKTHNNIPLFINIGLFVMAGVTALVISIRFFKKNKVLRTWMP